MHNDLTIKEYDHLRDLIEARESAIRVLFSTSVSVSIPLLSAIIGFVFTRDMQFVFSYLFLCPVLISIPFFQLLSSHRRDLFRAGNYIRVFFDEDRGGHGWDTSLNKYRKIEHGESLNTIHYLYWALHVICSFLFLYTLLVQGSSVLPHLIPLLIVTLFLTRANRTYRSAWNQRSRMLDVWRQVANEEKDT